ncbi:MAG: TldD/PmbA family protein [Candidatus Margulisbacteria bacterium]|nr:TldD/PmbA family protein [Candidatus Margulisiibacteriota bacterium]
MQELGPDLIKEILDVALSAGGQFSDIYLEDEELFSFVLENKKVKMIKSGMDKGLHLRTVNKDRSYSACSDQLGKDSLLMLARNIAQSVQSEQEAVAQKSKKITQESAASSIHLDEYQQIIDKFFQTNNNIYSMSDKIIQVTLSYFHAKKNIVIANSLGEHATDRRIYTRYMLHIVAQDGQATQTAYEGPGITGGSDLLKLYPPEEVVQKTVKRALTMLYAEQAPTGKMPVVLMGEAGGTMIHEACGHALEADFIYKDSSIFKNNMGKKVASEIVTVIDDGSIPGLYGSYGIDDEGVKPQKTILINKGILTSFLTDRMYGGLLGLTLSGNGRRESYHSKPVPRMSNTFIENSDRSPSEIIDSVKNGLLVKKMGGGQVNITNGDFVFEVAEGYLIKNGKIDKPIRGASLIGNGPDVLHQIEMVGNDKYFLPGVCGKYDHVPVADAQPTIKIKEMTIGGQ